MLFFVELQMLTNHGYMIMSLCLHMFPATSVSFFFAFFGGIACFDYFNANTF